MLLLYCEYHQTNIENEYERHRIINIQETIHYPSKSDLKKKNIHSPLYLEQFSTQVATEEIQYSGTCMYIAYNNTLDFYLGIVILYFVIALLVYR